MKLSNAQATCLESIACAVRNQDPMSYPPKVTTDMENPRGVCTPATARSLLKRGLVEWVEGSSNIRLTDAGRKQANAGSTASS